jgi:uncharacterized integral membrane protein
MNVKVVFSMVLLFIVVFFTLQNTEVVAMRFFFWEFSLSRALMFFLILGVGILTGYVLGAYSRERNGYGEKPRKDNQ